MEFVMYAASCIKTNKKLTVGKQSIRKENEVQLTDAIFKFNHLFLLLLCFVYGTEQYHSAK